MLKSAQQFGGSTVRLQLYDSVFQTGALTLNAFDSAIAIRCTVNSHGPSRTIYGSDLGLGYHGPRPPSQTLNITFRVAIDTILTPAKMTTYLNKSP